MKEQLLKDAALIHSLVAKDGPDLEDYQALNLWYDGIGAKRESKEYTEEDIDYLRAQFGDTYLTGKALQGFVYTKPHGYRGDFEIIDMIYQKFVSSNKQFSKWDTWFHSLAATKAVRNRKGYFKRIMQEKEESKPLEVLNLASGPCRDLFEFFNTHPNADITFDCVEIDNNAIQFAEDLLGPNLKKVNFLNKNIFRFSPSKTYDLIWSAGLFDYFDDKTFVRILQRYGQSLNEQGEIVIGNFHPSNSSRRIMEFGLWYLHHRDEAQLIRLASEAGFATNRIVIEEESEGVNLFMRIKN